MKNIRTLLLFIILVISILHLLLSLSMFTMISNEINANSNTIRPKVTIIEESEK